MHFYPPKELKKKSINTMKWNACSPLKKVVPDVHISQKTPTPNHFEKNFKLKVNFRTN